MRTPIEAHLRDDDPTTWTLVIRGRAADTVRGVSHMALLPQELHQEALCKVALPTIERLAEPPRF